jgi:phage terminase large subunit
MELERLGYPRLYVRESYDNYTHKAKKSYGFQTGPKNRNAILAELIRVVREDIRLVSDKDTLEEMLTFVRNEHFRPEAEEGAHDDCIMALAIAHAIRPQQRYTETVQEDRKEWSDSMKEDYWNASREERAMLIRLWGRPSNL